MAVSDLVVAGVDPGQSVGVFALDEPGRVLVARQLPPREAVDLLESAITAWCVAGRDVLVGCEPFVITQRTARLAGRPVALEVVGQVRRVVERNGLVLHQVPPSVSKRMASNDLLRRLGLWTPTPPDASDPNDVNDAARQALGVLAIHRPSVFDALLRRGSI